MKKKLHHQLQLILMPQQSDRWFVYCYSSKSLRSRMSDMWCKINDFETLQNSDSGCPGSHTGIIRILEQRTYWLGSIPSLTWSIHMVGPAHQICKFTWYDRVSRSSDNSSSQWRRVIVFTFWPVSTPGGPSYPGKGWGSIYVWGLERGPTLFLKIWQ